MNRYPRCLINPENNEKFQEKATINRDNKQTNIDTGELHGRRMGKGEKPYGITELLKYE